MLRNISWTSFIVVCVVSLAGYYVYVLIAFYRKDMMSLVTGRNRSAKQNRQEDRFANTTSESQKKVGRQPDAGQEDSFTLVHELLEDLKDLFLHASRIHMIKEELIQGIGSKLKQYASVQDTDLVEDINTHVVMEAKDKCNIDILPEDLKRIWQSKHHFSILPSRAVEPSA